MSDYLHKTGGICASDRVRSERRKEVGWGCGATVEKKIRITRETRHPKSYLISD